MKNLLLLGGGNCQRSAALRARQRGISVSLADYLESPPAASLADRHLRVSTFDIDGCTKAAMQTGADGVMTLGTDQPVYTAACVSERLGLPSLISAETALKVTNKREMKLCMTKAGITTAPYRFLRSEDGAAALDGLEPPYVIKPVDSQGQRGIFLLENREQVLSHVPQTLSFSRSDTVLVESYYKSDEVTVSAWVKNGFAVLLTITDRLHYPDRKHIGVCIGHRFPSVHMDMAEEIRDVCQKLCSAFEIENGPLYVQLLLGDKGIFVNELACRIGGAFEDYIIPYISGFDILDAVISASLGMEPNTGELKGFDVASAARHAAVQLLFCRSGKISYETSADELMALPYVLDAGYNYLPGDLVPPMENATARLGHAVLAAESADEMSCCIRDFYNTIKVTDAGGNDMLLRLYPRL